MHRHSEGEHDHAHIESGGDPHDHGASLKRLSRHRLLIALILTSSFMVAEIVAGLLSNSLALLSDAGHMATDAGALALALWAQALGKRARTGKLTFGFKRVEILAAAVNGVVLGVMAVVVIVEAIRRFDAPPEIHGWPMLIVATGGLGINLLSAWILTRVGENNINIRAAAAHVLADAAGSVAAILAGVAILGFGWSLADPLMSIGISVFILVGAWRLLRESVAVLMEGAPAAVDVAALERLVLETPGVREAHDLHVWSIAGDVPVVTVHVTLSEGHHGVEVADRVGRRLREKIAGAHVTVQPEASHQGVRLLPPETLIRSRRNQDD